MARVKITITGVPEKEPKRHENGKVDLVFLAQQSGGVPKGLEPLKNCPCLVHVAAFQWENVQGEVQPESKLVVQGEVSPRVNKKGVAFLDVVAMGIGLVEKKVAGGEEQQAAPTRPQTKPEKPVPQPPKKPRLRGLETPKGTQEMVELAHIKIPEHLTPPNPEEVGGMVAYVEAHHTFDKPLLLKKESQMLLDGYKWYLAAKELNIERVPITYTKPTEGAKSQRGAASEREIGSSWYKAEDVFSVKVSDILLTEPIHYEAKEISLPKKLAWYVEHPEEKLPPVVVRRLEEKYSLVTGVQRYFLAKILGLEHVPAVETELSHEAFMKEHGWVERPIPARGKK